MSGRQLIRLELMAMAKGLSAHYAVPKSEGDGGAVQPLIDLPATFAVGWSS